MEDASVTRTDHLLPGPSAIRDQNLRDLALYHCQLDNNGVLILDLKGTVPAQPKNAMLKTGEPDI
jgi:hypothetical protein